jgi:uracil phosphoribosyltransferase
MAKTTELTTNTKKFRDIQSILKDPAAKAKLTNLVDEAVKCKSAIAMQQTNIKVLRDEAKADLEVDPKLFNTFVAASYNNDYAQRKTSLDEQLTLIMGIMGEIGYEAPDSDD